MNNNNNNKYPHNISHNNNINRNQEKVVGCGIQIRRVVVRVVAVMVGVIKTRKRLLEMVREEEWYCIWLTFEVVDN